jgi:Mg2+-importing ATPase
MAEALMSLFPRNMPIGAAKERISNRAPGGRASASSSAHASAFAKSGAESAERLRKACAVGVEEAYALLETRREGLLPGEAAERRKRFGPNVLSGERRAGPVAEILGRFKDPLAIQLLVICIVSYAMGDIRAGSVVLCMILVSVALAYVQERRSGDAAEKLKLMIHASAMALRGGEESEIPIADIVPGDIVALSAGSIVSADMRIVVAKDFFVAQAALTGESLPVEKEASPEGAEARAPGGGEGGVFDLGDACFQGSTVISGSARGIAVNTGMRTFLGSVAADLSEPKGATDFDSGTKAFVALMVRLMLVMVAATFLVVGLSKGDWLEALLFGLSVAVGLTPEMLPMIVTVCLSKGAVFMSRKKVIVKRLKAIQNLGAMDVLCTDKTGTITQDKVALERHVDVTSRPSEDVLRYAWMNSYYQTGLRNLLDLSILSNEDLDVERSCKKVDEIPFDFVRKRMSVVIEYEGDHVLICKGAVEAVFEACDRYQVDEEVLPLIELLRRDILEEYPSDKEGFSAADESGLILLGYLAFFDPPKDSAEKAIRSLGERGVRVKVLTGDNELVTRKICADVGLADRGVLTGRELEAMDEGAFSRAAAEHDVFARLTPSQKERIVRALRAQGRVVGFMGDGINDAAAMRAADVGISVDTAVDVAKESADIILLEKSLLVLEEGILEGRRLFNNILKYIRMSASSNFGNMFSVLGSAFLLPFLPMAPVQILLNNLLYDISQAGIPLDNVDAEAVKKPQKWDLSLIRKFMLRIGPISSIFDYATFGLMWWVFGCSAFLGASTGAADKDYLQRLFHTGWFVESLLTQTLIIHIIRTNRIPFFQSRASLALTFATLAVMAIGVALPYSPLAPFFGLVPLPARYWLWIGGFLACYALLTQLAKTAFSRNRGGIAR